MIQRYLIAKGAMLIEKQTCSDCRKAWEYLDCVEVFDCDEKPTAKICLEKHCIAFNKVVDFSRTR